MDPSQQRPDEDDADTELPRGPVRNSGDYFGPFIQSDPLGNVTTYTYFYDVSPQLFKVEHDRDKRRFAMTGPDGETTEFHDRAVRFLVVEPDPETGELTPVIRRGNPKVIYLCREAGL
jgi:hypothetical protein